MPWKISPPIAPTRRAKINAKTMRRLPTEAEQRLWWHLRHRLPVEGSHFRRQVALARYVADFCCLDAKLIVEVDGGGHGADAQAARDATRTQELEAQGFRVLRFTNAEIMRSIDGVLDTILAALPSPAMEAETPSAPAEPSGTTPTSNSSPQG